jgi:cobalt/nickel transport system permease protein
MHIPDGYLSPQTYVPCYLISAAFLSIGLKKIRTEVSSRHIPYFAMAATFAFLIQMFNIPVPGGTTGHAVGAAVVALLLGPWTGVVAVSVVLIIQALVFGDGGITAIGANSLTMAIVMPFTATWIFRLVKGRSRTGRRVMIAAFVAGYISLLAAAIGAAILFGIQPLIASGPDGRPLYAPYPLSVALPVMALEHMFVFSIIEGLITALLVNYFLKNEPDAIFALKGT